MKNNNKKNHINPKEYVFMELSLNFLISRDNLAFNKSI